MGTVSLSTQGPVVADREPSGRTRPRANRPPDPPRKVPRTWQIYLGTGLVYLVISLLLWWHVLPHPSSVTTCGCGDAALTLWVVKWPSFALSHGLNPFYSSRLFYPGGINMVPNSLALGMLTAPVTWVFGPVASLNVIDVLSPPLSGLAMFWLLRRWTTWAPAAFVGALFFGFSPFVLTSLALAHPNFGLLAPVPLIIGCIDDLFVRRRRRPIRVGIVLGLLVVLEFFVSVEVLALLVLFGALAAIGFVFRAVLRHRTQAMAAAFREGGRGLLAAAFVTALVLAYPLWIFFHGPAHLVGRAWPNSPAGTVVNRPGDFVAGTISPGLTTVMHLFGGYQGPQLPLLCFLGVGMIVVLAVGSLLFWREPVLQCFGLLGLVAVVLSFGVVTGVWTPWRFFTHLPVLVNVVPVNISAIIDTCAAVVLAVILDRAHSWLGRRRHKPAGVAATAAGIGIALLALVPLIVAYWPNIPMTVRAVRSPRWFAVAASRLGARTVVLPYPAALGGIQSSMAWQATEGMTFSMVGGGGPGIAPSRAGPERAGQDVLNRAALPLTPPPQPTAANLAAVRSALRGWRVTTVVVPDEPGLRTYDKGRGASYAVGLFTAALGVAPRFETGAWVWSLASGQSGAAPVPLTPTAFSTCIGRYRAAAVADVAPCVLRRA